MCVCVCVCVCAVELMAGSWTATSFVAYEASPAKRGAYKGTALAAVTPCGTTWTQLSAVVNLPNGSAGSMSYNHSEVVNGTRRWELTNGTALQIRITAPPSERSHGARVWIGAASITEQPVETHGIATTATTK